MAEPMSDERLADIRASIDRPGGKLSEQSERDLLAEVDRLREELAEARGRMTWRGEDSLAPGRVPSCLSCSEPAEDSGEGRFCGGCEDYEGTCVNDHCLTCGRTT